MRSPATAVQDDTASVLLLYNMVLPLTRQIVVWITSVNPNSIAFIFRILESTACALPGWFFAPTLKAISHFVHSALKPGRAEY